ncbi:MAG: prepilin-type N-terminal cleavage/methylation domain-containing protein [Deltaproteobacteria bacterium]|nr:prepilin-type N-terminal cleavage/methylation domain-containing protein [Deltaproteobacteria bacterium]
MLKSKKSREKGFTLIELLIAMALALVIIGALSSAFVSQRKTYAVQEQVSEMIQNARAAMDMITREVKMAGYDPAEIPIAGIPYSATQLELQADLNGDGDTSDSNEDIIYTYLSANKQIGRNTGGGAQPLAENIQAFTFQYYDMNGAATTTTADIRQIKIIITARTSEPDPDYSANSGYRTYTLTSYVTPPNLDL